jgi:hypothetical protein
MGKTFVILIHRTPGVQRAIAGAVPLPTVGMVPSCLFNVISQNDAHGHYEYFQQLFPRAGVERL